ncbi:RagB/SusD family nutrient uptake outer membrane protein [Aquimarina sp. 2201CG5-10]|uniref:RagB/SusD family nutrient uptake outer membrane protein n=1 Tax=Aquimarina callyspongiae TaxID=3098150 RepID=UPI002AB46DF1|nr:RagB/SusD family nutrient uptake outer membrane protein [Aquimarina sp. 2201CG5-10]MDY8134748.1 RagB/SusD family nutrient uptake outer membrane protein [Aquimarina sp. 2201CG5-10]
MKKLRFITMMMLCIGIPFLLLESCTDLDPSFDDSIPAEDSSGAFTGVDPTNFLESAYNDIEAMGDQANTYALLEVSSDELVVLTRGADWGDNGIWRTMHQHNWDPNHGHVLTTWNQRNAAVFRCNQIIAPESEATPNQVAQAKTLRALNMFYVMDLFGQVPFRGVNDGIDVDPVVFTRAEAFDFIIQDLTEALPDLGDADQSDIYTITKAFANFLLAKMYLNKEVYTGSADATDYTRVVEFCDAITTGGYTLDSDYFGIFLPGHTNQEIILALDTWTGNRVFNILHPNQGGWNGFATLGEVYDSFDASDLRVGEPNTAGLGTGMLIGQQYAPDGTALTDRGGAPLVFTKDFPTGISGNNERTGVRPHKYTANDAGAAAPGNGTVLARYADVVLMKAEAIMKGGTSAETAESLIDNLRTIRGVTASGSYTMAELLEERRRELYIEGWRRNDQIRFGTFNATWDMKDNTEDFRVLFPIPASAVATNPNLSQNTGY